MVNGNEKRIITVLNHRGPSTRKELSVACGISWAATVKLVGRLETQGMIRCLGESSRKTENGKTSLVYDIAEMQPLAIGIDIEYALTTITAQNLRHSLLYIETVPTPERCGPEELAFFLAGLVEKCRNDLAARNLSAEGIGVGMPGMLIASAQLPFEAVAEALSCACSLPVVADNNIRAYTLYLQKQFATGDSFAAFIIRRGIGVGITLEGKLFRGNSGQSGELGHLTVDSEGPPCRCGGRGCVEVYFNQRELARAWAAAAGLPPPQEPEERQLVSDFFSRASAGDPEAAALLGQKATKLLPAVTGLLLSFDIRNIVINGHFGPQGGTLVSTLSQDLARTISSRFRYALSYREIEDEGFAIGAAMLFQNKYYDYSVLSHSPDIVI
jgi:predicted NBD/HSP70 family sugar kinase